MTGADPIPGEADFSKLREKLAKKIAAYSHWPDSRKLGDKLLPFTESEEFVFFLADILRNDRWDDYPEFYVNKSHGGKYVSYGVFIHILIQYVIHGKARCGEIISVLEYAADKAVATVMRDEFDNEYYMLRCIFNNYKKETRFPAGLPKKLDAVPDDKLQFKLIDSNNGSNNDSDNDGGSAYEVRAYSGFTRGEIKIPPIWNGKPVKRIAYRGFDGCGITGVAIPEGLDDIGGFAFDGAKLKSIRLPRSLKSIGEYAFRYCRLSGEVVIPGQVEKMGGYVFESTSISGIRVEGYAEKPAGWSDDWNKKEPAIFFRCASSGEKKSGGSAFHRVIWDKTL
jgi:hypothetical protein